MNKIEILFIDHANDGLIFQIINIFFNYNYYGILIKTWRSNDNINNEHDKVNYLFESHDF